MKKIAFVLILTIYCIFGFSQVKDYVVHAVEVLKTDSVLVINNDTIFIDESSADGQFIRKVSGKWINQDFSGTGTDSLVFRTSDMYLLDYRAGSIYDSILIQFEDITLSSGDTRTIKIDQSSTGAGNHLVFMAGADDDGQGGGNTYIKGGGGTEFGDVYIGSGNQYSTIYLIDTIDANGMRIKNLADAIEGSDAVTLSQIEGLTQSVYSIALPYSTTVAGRVNGATEGTDYPTGWVLAAAANNIDLVVTHSLGRRVAEVNVLSVNGTIEQLLRPFAGAYSGWQTNDANTLQINSLATIPLPIKIYIIFE